MSPSNESVSASNSPSAPEISGSETSEIQKPRSRAQKILTIGGWVLLGLICLVLFTIVKIPEDRVKNLIEGNLAAVLAPQGISFVANDSKLSVIFGISYTMKDVTVRFTSPAQTVHLDKIQISPSLIPLILGTLRGNVAIENLGGDLSVSFSIKNSDVSISFNAKKMDLGKLGILPVLAGVQGSAVLDGDGSISGDISLPSTLEGNLELHLSKVLVDSQSIAGFSIPKLSISEGTVEVRFEKAKATIKTFKLGKPGNAADDILGNVTGDIALGKRWDISTLALKTKVSFSETVMKSFVLLDAILGAGKQTDGSYAFSLTGPLGSPISTPVPPQ